MVVKIKVVVGSVVVVEHGPMTLVTFPSFPQVAVIQVSSPSCVL